MPEMSLAEVEPQGRRVNLGARSMLWFRHMSAAADGETCAEILEAMGAAGYGSWWLMLEAIAGRMDESDECSLMWPVSNWRKKLKFSRTKLEVFLNIVATNSDLTFVFSQKNGAEYLEVRCPKLIEIRDDYSKRRARESGHSPDTLRLHDRPIIHHSKADQSTRHKDLSLMESTSRQSRVFSNPQDEAVKSYFKAFCTGTGLGLSFRDSIHMQKSEELSVKANNPKQVEVVAAFYKLRCGSDCTPSFMRFVANWDHWRAGLEASKADGSSIADMERKRGSSNDE